MKKIFVTVREFLDNGGLLKLERTLYNSKLEPIGWYDGTFDIEDELVGMIRVRNGRGSFPGTTYIIFIEIDATPIYQ